MLLLCSSRDLGVGRQREHSGESLQGSPGHAGTRKLQFLSHGSAEVKWEKDVRDVLLLGQEEP